MYTLSKSNTSNMIWIESIGIKFQSVQNRQQFYMSCFSRRRKPLALLSFYQKPLGYFQPYLAKSILCV